MTTPKPKKRPANPERLKPIALRVVERWEEDLKLVVVEPDIYPGIVDA